MYMTSGASVSFLSNIVALITMKNKVSHLNNSHCSKNIIQTENKFIEKCYCVCVYLSMKYFENIIKHIEMTLLLFI